MLKNLKISNYALIRSLDMPVGPGFCAITGETGAGKSILLGALGLVLGQRADTGVLYDKQRKCVVEAEFDLQGGDFSDFFREHDLDDSAAGAEGAEGAADATAGEVPTEVIIRREVLPAGKSRAFINDTPVTLPVLKELTGRLVDIHSQHETLALNHASFQLNLVDSYLSDKAPLAAYKALYARYAEAMGRLNRLKEEREKARKDRDYWEFLYGELEQLNLKAGEQAEMESELETLVHAQDLQESFSGALNLLQGEEGGVVSNLKEMLRSLKKAATHHAAMGESLPRWESLLVELEDLAQDLQRFNDAVEADPRKQQAYEERLDALYRLEKKHAVESDEDLIRLRDDLASKLNLAQNAGEQIEELEKETAQLERELGAAAQQLHQARLQSAAALQTAILAALAELGMEKSRLEIDLSDIGHYGTDGRDKAVFLFSANPGGELREISKVASGGELSRLMLAVKSVIHQGSLLGTLILDEIDTGVSGQIAGKVARMMKNLSRYMQVIAITHLPQIAAAADLHYRVYKEVEDGITASHMQRLNQEEHIEHIARMLSNGEPTAAALVMAKELINE